MSLFPRIAVLLGTLALFAAGTARAQAQECLSEDTVCETGNCVLQKLPYEEFIAAPPTSRGGRNVPPVADRPFNPDEGERIVVRGFRVEGVSPRPDLGVTPQTVQAAADEAFRRETGGAETGRLTVGHMTRVSDAVTTFYRSKGYLVAKAFLPAQDIGTDQIIRIQVLEGRIGEVAVEGAQRYSPEVLRKPSEGLVGQVPIRGEVETALLYTQDYPGVQLFGTFKPGQQLGDTRLVLQVQNEDRFGFAVGGDNYGNEFTGTYRVRADAAWKNPFGRGDEASVTLLQAINPANTTFYAAGYRLPVGPRGFSVSVGASSNAFSLAGPLEPLDLEGTTESVDVGAEWRFVRQRFRNLRAGLTLSNKTSDLEAVSGTLQITDDAYTVAVAEVGGENIDVVFRGVDQGTLRVRQSLDTDLGGQVDESFTVFEGRYTRVQALGETQTAVFRGRLQQTGNTLSPLEQFSLAGPDAVRAYPVGQSLTDSGLYASLEYRVQAPGFARAAGPFGRTWGDLLSLLAFYDYAQGSDNLAGSPSTDLSGAGLGLQFAIPGRFTAQLQGAVPVSSAETDDGKDFRLYGEFSIRF